MKLLKHAGIKPALLGLTLATALLASNAWAGPVRIQGGGIAVFNDDVVFDSDLEDTDGSAFGFNVVIADDGSVTGHLRYMMVGRTDFDGLGPQVMHNPVSDAKVNADGSITIYSKGLLHNWKGQFHEAEIALTITAGGPGVGTIQATSTIPAFGLFNAPFPLQTLVSGQIEIR